MTLHNIHIRTYNIREANIACEKDTKRRAHELIEVTGLLENLQRVACKPATRDQILRVHTAEYHDLIYKKSEDGGGDVGDGQSLVNSDFIAISSSNC